MAELIKLIMVERVAGNVKESGKKSRELPPCAKEKEVALLGKCYDNVYRKL